MTDKDMRFLQFDEAIAEIVQDQETGLDRYFRITLDLQFVEVRTVGEPRELTEKERDID